MKSVEVGNLGVHLCLSRKALFDNLKLCSTGNDICLNAISFRCFALTSRYSRLTNFGFDGLVTAQENE